MERPVNLGSSGRVRQRRRQSVGPRGIRVADRDPAEPERATDQLRSGANTPARGAAVANANDLANGPRHVRSKRSAGLEQADWVQLDSRAYTGRYMVAVRPRGGRFGTPVAVGAAGNTPPVLAVAPDGAAVIAWSTSSAHKAVVRPSGGCASARVRGCFGAAETFDPVQTFDAGGDPALTFGPGGSAYLAWPSLCGACTRLPRPCIQLAVAAHSQRFGAPQTITERSVGCGQPAVAVAADGTAVIAWRASPDSSSEGSRQGEVIVLWQQRADFRNSTLTAAVGRIGGPFGVPTRLSPPSEERILSGSLAVDHRGNAVVVYNHNRRTFSRLRAPGQAFADPTGLITHGELGGPLIAAANKITAIQLTAAGTELSDWTP